MPATIAAPPDTGTDPFADLIGSGNAPDYGTFADLVPKDSFSSGEKQAGADFGQFSDLVPQSPTSETEKAVAETPDTEKMSDLERLVVGLGPKKPAESNYMKLEKGMERMTGLPIHQNLNILRNLAAGAGKYIFNGLQGFEVARANELTKPSYLGGVPTFMLPPERAAELEKQYHDDALAQIPDAKATADYFKQLAANTDSNLGVDPELANTIPARLAHTVGSAGTMALESLLPGAGIPLMVMHGALATEAEAKNAGKTDAEAEAAGARSAIGLALFGGASKLAALGVAHFLPEGAAPLTKFLSQFTTQWAANETSSRAINAWEKASEAEPGKKIEAALNALKDTTLEQSTLNTVYALAHASSAAGKEPVRPANEPVQPQLRSISEAMAERRTSSLPERSLPDPSTIIGSADNPRQNIPGIDIPREDVSGEPIEQAPMAEALKPDVAPAEEARLKAETPRQQAEREAQNLPFTSKETKAEWIDEQEARLAATKPVEPIVIDKTVKEQFRDFSGAINLPAATQHIGNEVQAALDRGDTVNLIADFGRKTVPIANVRNGMLIDAQRQPWGTFDVLSGGSKIEIKTAKAEPIGVADEITEIQRRNAPAPNIEPTSTKNEATFAEREARGIAPAEEVARRDFGTVWDETKTITETDPTAPERLAREVATNPRTLSDKENALLLRRQIEVQNEHDAAINAVNNAPDEATRMDANARLERARDNLQIVYDATNKAGTETARGLNARKMLANNDFSLAKMEAETRAVVNDGKPLNAKQAAEVKVLYDRIATAEAKVSAYEAREQFETELKKARAESKQKGFQPVSFLEQQAQRARERIVARRGRLYSDPLGVTQIAHLADEAIIGASHIAKGLTKFTDWSAQMIAEFGERIKPHLQALFAKARELHGKAQISQPLPGRADMLSRTAAGESRFERAIGGDKNRIRSNIAKLESKTAAGDFIQPEKRPPRMDKQKAALLFEYQKAKDAYNKGLLDAKLRKQSIPRKVLRYGGEALNTTRAIMTSFDLSAVLRQGGFIAFGHPVRALQAFPDMLRALRSEESQFRVMEDIRNRPNAPLYAQSKLYISDQGPGVKLSQMEEQYMSRWARRIPGVGASERAYTTFLNRLRADSFDTMAENLGKHGKVTIEEAKAIANYVNVATGRGNLDGAAKAATGLNTLFFSPRYVVSRFQLLAGQPFYRGTARTRALVAKEYARTLAGAAIVYALGQASGATISTDPTSPDFGKLKFGNTRVDMLFGLTQASVFLSREGLALKRFLTQDQGKQPKYGSGGEVLGRFLRSKLSPVIGSAVDILSGKNVVGQKVTPRSVAQQLVVPLSFGDIYNAMKEQGVVRGTALSILALFGMGIQNYSTKTGDTSHPRSYRPKH